jgi:hypothetical protein
MDAAQDQLGHTTRKMTQQIRPSQAREIGQSNQVNFVPQKKAPAPDFIGFQEHQNAVIAELEMM